MSRKTSKPTLWARGIEELTEEELEQLMQVDPAEFAVELKETWEDDHLPCVGVVIDGVPIGFWYLKHYAAAAFWYLDSMAARKVVIDLLRETLLAYFMEKHDLFKRLTDHLNNNIVR